MLKELKELGSKKRNEKIIIVEDDQVVSKLHKFSIRKVADKDVVCCNDGLETLNYLDEEAAALDHILILLDLNMPVMNGPEFLQVCQKKPYRDKLEVFVVTSSTSKKDLAFQEQYDQVKGYYSKPLNTSDIKEILQQSSVHYSS